MIIIDTFPYHLGSHAGDKAPFCLLCPPEWDAEKSGKSDQPENSLFRGSAEEL